MTLKFNMALLYMINVLPKHFVFTSRPFDIDKTEEMFFHYCLYRKKSQPYSVNFTAVLGQNLSFTLRLHINIPYCFAGTHTLETSAITSWLSEQSVTCNKPHTSVEQSTLPGAKS